MTGTAQIQVDGGETVSDDALDDGSRVLLGELEQSQRTECNQVHMQSTSAGEKQFSTEIFIQDV